MPAETKQEWLLLLNQLLAEHIPDSEWRRIQCDSVRNDRLGAWDDPLFRGCAMHFNAYPQSPRAGYDTAVLLNLRSGSVWVGDECTVATGFGEEGIGFKIPPDWLARLRAVRWPLP